MTETQLQNLLSVYINNLRALFDHEPSSSIMLETLLFQASERELSSARGHDWIRTKCLQSHPFSGNHYDWMKPQNLRDIAQKIKIFLAGNASERASENQNESGAEVTHME